MFLWLLAGDRGTRSQAAVRDPPTATQSWRTTLFTIAAV
jgi:hypothetical protein